MPGFEVDPAALAAARAAVLDGTGALSALASRGPEHPCGAAADALPGARTSAALRDVAAAAARALDASTGAVAGFADLLGEAARRYAEADGRVAR